MVNYIEHDDVGNIIALTTSSDKNAQIPDLPNLVVVNGSVSIPTHYVDNGQVWEKQPFQFIISKSQIIANGVDEALITNIPAGTTVEWPDGQIDEVTGGEVGFAVDLPGTYTLVFDAVPYLREEVTLEAVPAA